MFGLLAGLFATYGTHRTTAVAPASSPLGEPSDVYRDLGPSAPWAPPPGHPPRGSTPIAGAPPPPGLPPGAGAPFSTEPAPSSGGSGDRVEAPFSWLWWWWYFDLESRHGPRLGTLWARWTSQGGLVGAVSSALFGDYTVAAWALLTLAVTGTASAGIGYCIWCLTGALVTCCAPCRQCLRRRASPPREDEPTRRYPQEAPPLRGPLGQGPTDNEFYARIKNTDRKRGGRPHLLIATGDHTARVAQPEGGPTPRANAHGVTLDYTEVISASSRRARTQLESAATKRVHLCREHPCRAEMDVALHATAYAPIDRDHPLDLKKPPAGPPSWRSRAWEVCRCLWWTCHRTGSVGYQAGRGVRRLGVLACCRRRRSNPDTTAPGAWRDTLSESESEPEDRKSTRLNSSHSSVSRMPSSA